VNAAQPREAIVVSGASTGIGASAAERLARDGFLVFAGVRGDADAENVEALHPNVRALRLDVTDAESIAAAKNTVAAAGVPLRGLVNNAGVAIAGPVEFLPLAQWRRQFEVNFFGAIALTQAFLPLLRATKGRIVFVGSVSGRLASPFVGAYSSSKFALRAMSDALRVELEPSGIRVTLVEPGNVKTPIWQKGRDSKAELVGLMPAAALEHYGGHMDALYAATEGEERAGLPAERVSDAIARALSSPTPRTHHLVGAQARIGSTLALMPARLRSWALRRSLRLPNS
jgi:NAD(P)-dependent dehydrogenase (short-subunit alcohol dehydrogenase family)